jgi:hypothetical protein
MVSGHARTTHSRPSGRAAWLRVTHSTNAGVSIVKLLMRRPALCKPVAGGPDAQAPNKASRALQGSVADTSLPTPRNTTPGSQTHSQQHDSASDFPTCPHELHHDDQWLVGRYIRQACVHALNRGGAALVPGWRACKGLDEAAKQQGTGGPRAQMARGFGCSGRHVKNGRRSAACKPHAQEAHFDCITAHTPS